MITKIKHKIKSLYHRYYSSKKGYGLRVQPEVWEQQFKDRFWDYLHSEAEQEHYQMIANYYQEFGRGGDVLDIGCGNGVLFRHLHPLLPQDAYLGIDIAQAAIQQCQIQYPTTDFRVLDYDYENLDYRADVIIFNETLYYFEQPLETLKKCIRENLKEGGILIISMCDYGNHDLIWEMIEGCYKMKVEILVNNVRAQNWKVKVFESTPV